MRDRVTGEHCAFKLLSAHAGEHELDALIREFITLSSLEGLGLPRVIRFGRLPQGDRPYVLRELIAGESLDKVMPNAPARALESLAQIAEQLTVLHRAGVLHGDIKPANIICRDAGPATLVDFGLATHSSTQAQPHGLTPRYAAPEVFAGQPLTTRAEVFALGMILREISEFLHLDEFALSVIDALAEVVDQATSADPGRRPPSADEFVAALRIAAQLPDELRARNTALAWPIVGIEGTSAQLLARTLSLDAGESLRIDGQPGAGRSVLLRKLAWSLGVAGKHLAFIDADVRRDERAFDSELAQAPADRESYILVDDADQLREREHAAVRERSAAGARLVTVGTLEGHTSDLCIRVPPLERSIAADLLRKSVPSLTDEALERILEEAQCRPEALREWVTRIADGTFTNIDDVMQLSQVPTSITDTPCSLAAVQTLLDRGRYKEAAVLLDRIAVNDDQAQALTVARARLKLGIGEPQRALELLRPYVQDTGAQGASPEMWLHWARACLGIGDYAGAVEAALRISEHETVLHAEAMIQRGLAECYLGKPEAARAALLEALQQAEALAAKRVLGLAHAALGFVAQRESELDQALTHYQEAIKAGQECADASLLANAELNLAGLLKMRGDIAGAIEHFEAAVDGGERSGRRATVRHALLNLANLDLFLGRLARARSRLQALEADRDSLQPAQEAQRLGLEAELALRLGQPSDAERLFSQSALAYRTLSRDLDEAEARLEAILAAARLDQPDLVQLRARIESLRDQLASSGAHKALFHLAEGRVALASGIETVARRAIEMAESEARSSGHKDWLWRALEAHADLEQSAGGLLRARQYRENALSLLEEMAATLPRDLREVYWNDGRRRQLRAAVAQTRYPDSDAAAVSPPFTAAEATGGISTWLSNPIDQRLAKILEVNAELASDLRLDYLTDRIIEHAIRLSGAELGLILLRDSEGKLSVQSSRSVTPGEQRLRFSTTIAETAINSGQPLVTLSAKDDQRMSGWSSVHDLMVQSVACVPIRAGRGPTIGALYLETRMRRGSRFQSELPMLQAFADQAAIALQSARLIKENHDRAEELKESNRKLHEAQQRLEELLGNRTQQLVRTRRQLQQTRQTLYSHFGYHGLVGTSEAMRRVYAVIDRVKSADVGVLVTGESGTGKEMVARAIHAASDRSRGPFVGVNCGAIPENLLESELFGSVRGAFTGADRDRAGLFREGQGGTLLLDEIGEMPSKMQAGLLRVLQSKTVRPVGGRREEPVDVRVICATHRNLEELVATGSFREDLYYRIHVVEVRIPPLRDHREDIPQLVNHFFGLFAARFHQERKTVSREALRLLVGQPWRGNIRELEHVLLNAWIMSDADELNPQDFELAVSADAYQGRLEMPDLPEGTREWNTAARPAKSKASTGTSEPPLSTRQKQKAADEKQRILDALKACDHNKVKAAKMSGIPRRTFYRRLEAYGIK
jgi:transcriptional regulator with GAF, ATPase, and Fis domain/serine/threonine protein kinase/Tfp pilus assembly protein PilF